MSHTPGPWITAGPHGIGIAPAAMPDERLAVVMAMDCELTEEDMYGEDVPLASQVANARLISAAPDLLAACEELLIYLGDWDDMDNDTCAAARKAIAKAKGESL